MSGSAEGVAGPSGSVEKQQRGNGVAFADQCILIPNGFVRAALSYAAADQEASPAAGPSRTTGSDDLQYTAQQPSTDIALADEPLTAPATYKAAAESESLEGALLNTYGTASVLSPKSILKQPRKARAGGVSKDQSSSSLSGVGSEPASVIAPAASSASPGTPTKAAPLPFQAILQAPTPQKGVAAPRPAYRPLVLGSASDEDDDPSSPRKAAAPASLPPPSLASAPLGSGKRLPHDGQGPPVIHSEELAEAASRRYQGRFERTTDSAPPSPSLSTLELSAGSPLTLPDNAGSPDGSQQQPEASRVSVPSAKTSISAEASTVRTSGSTLTRSVSESSHLVGSAPGSRRPHWLKRSRHSPLSHREEAPADDHISDAETDRSSRSVAEPELVPLNTECVCQHCSGRINAGLSATYIPHWSKGARAKWLADRKQAAQSESGGERLKAQTLSLSRDDAALVLPDSSRRSTRSPPPLSSHRAFDPARGVAPIGSHQSFRGVVTYHPVSQASANEPVRPQEAHVALRSSVGLEQGDEDATADLQQILDRKKGTSPTMADKVQVDEVDKKHGRASQPSALADLSSPELAVNQHGFFPPVDLFPVFRSSPVGVSEEETIDADAALAHQVELEVRAREEKQRNERVRRRGGARGMMAMLEEAGTQEDIAKEQRILRRSSVTGESQSPLTTHQSLNTSAHDDTHGRAVAPPSPALSSPGSRSNSPFFDRLRDGFRSSSRSSNRSSHSEESRQTGLEDQSSHVQLPMAPPGKSRTPEEDRARRGRHSTGGLRERTSTRASDGLLTPAINQSHLSPRLNGREYARNSPPSPRLDSSRPLKPSRLGSSPGPTPALPLPRLSEVSTMPASMEESKSADSLRAKPQSFDDRRIIEPDRAAGAAAKAAASSTSMTPTKSQQARDREKEKVYFGTTWNPSLSSSAASLTPGSTLPDSKPATAQTVKGAASAASQLANAGVGTSAGPAPASAAVQRRDVPAAKKSSANRESVILPSAPPSGAAPSMTARRSASQGHASSTQREAEKKAFQSQSKSPAATAASTEQTAERLKKRSLRRRLSAPIKGFFESKS